MNPRSRRLPAIGPAFPRPWSPSRPGHAHSRHCLQHESRLGSTPASMRRSLSGMRPTENSRVSQAISFSLPVALSRYRIPSTLSLPMISRFRGSGKGNTEVIKTLNLVSSLGRTDDPGFQGPPGPLSLQGHPSRHDQADVARPNDYHVLPWKETMDVDHFLSQAGREMPAGRVPGMVSISRVLSRHPVARTM